MARFGIFAFFVLVIPALLFGQSSRSKKSKAKGASPQEYARLRTMSKVVGTLSSVGPGANGTKVIFLDIPYPYPSRKSSSRAFLNPTYGAAGTSRTISYQSQLSTLQRQYQQALNYKNVAQRDQKLAYISARMQELQAKMAAQDTVQVGKVNQRLVLQAERLFGSAVRNAQYIALAYKRFDLEARDNVVVRRLELPALDAKGNVLKYTREERARLKGSDSSLTGYEAKLSDLQSGQVVQLFLEEAHAGSTGSSAQKNADPKQPGATQPALPRTRMVIILGDGDGE